tara:strand:+ start:231 stop:656 length:426 start_codon:yes stop_codon:yes gene_type:complete
VIDSAEFENNQLALSGEVTADYDTNTTFRAIGTTNPNLTQTQALALIDSYKENTSLVITDTVDARDTVELGESQGEWILLNRDVASSPKTGSIQNVGSTPDNFETSYSVLGDLKDGTGDIMVEHGNHTTYNNTTGKINKLN